MKTATKRESRIILLLAKHQAKYFPNATSTSLATGRVNEAATHESTAKTSPAPPAGATKESGVSYEP